MSLSPKRKRGILLRPSLALRAQTIASILTARNIIRGPGELHPAIQAYEAQVSTGPTARVFYRKRSDANVSRNGIAAI